MNLKKITNSKTRTLWLINIFALRHYSSIILTIEHPKVAPLKNKNGCRLEHVKAFSSEPTLKSELGFMAWIFKGAENVSTNMQQNWVSELWDRSCWQWLWNSSLWFVHVDVYFTYSRYLSSWSILRCMATHKQNHAGFEVDNICQV